MGQKGPIASVQGFLACLDAFIRAEEPVGPRELARLAEVNRGRAKRALDTIVAAEWGKRTCRGTVFPCLKLYQTLSAWLDSVDRFLIHPDYGSGKEEENGEGTSAATRPHG